MMTESRISPAGTRQSTPRLLWVEYIKAFALLWIFLNHTVERIFGGPLIANPWMNWPPLAERIAQLQPLQGSGILDIPLNVIRYAGWAGDQGVQLFLIISGFGLTWGLLSRGSGAVLALRPFYWRRATRIYPLWWLAHIFFLVLSIVLPGLGAISLADKTFYFSLLGIRITPEQFYYFSPAWWYIGLLVQLYLVFPLLWWLLNKLGPGKLLMVVGGMAFLIRGVGLFAADAYLPGYLDAWSRGAIFITRLPEFLFGMSLAAWLYKNPEQVERWRRRPTTLLLAVAAYLAGTLLSLFLWGMTVAPFLLGVGIFALLFALLGNRRVGVGIWLGQHSYTLYLTHHPFILALIPAGLSSVTRVGAGVVGALLLTVIAAFLLEVIESRLFGQTAPASIRGKVIQIGALLLAGAILALGSEYLVRQLNPQEVYGWGERISLEPDDTLGWRLKPNAVTRLRWKSYDYTVTANSLGFPGPEYPVDKSENALRIFVTGDAYSSAEGVNTDQAWPRLLERELADQFPDRPVEVMNFSITGYGPEQYAAVVEAYAPVYKPDLIIVESFVNDFDDVLLTNADFQQSIGFQEPAQDGLQSYLTLAQLRAFLKNEVKPALLRTDYPDGMFFSYISILERDQPDLDARQQAVLQWYQHIQAVADTIGAPVVLVFVPASSQVCAPADLPYFPRNVDLSDSNRFDLDLPQRLTQEITDTLGWGFYDLRDPLRNTPEGCPYMPYNLHWQVFGHEAVARFVASALTKAGYLPQAGDPTP